MSKKDGYVSAHGAVYNATTPTLADGDEISPQVDSSGRLKVVGDFNAGDIEIGQVELKDSDSTAQANIKVANTARTTGTVVVATQHIDADGTVGGVTLNTALDKTNDSITNYPVGCTCTTVDLATDADVVVTAAPAYLMGVFVSVVMSAHAAIIKDNATAVITLPASTAAGTNIDAHSTTFATNITVESDNSGTGTLLIFWRAA